MDRSQGGADSMIGRVGGMRLHLSALSLLLLLLCVLDSGYAFQPAVLSLAKHYRCRHLCQPGKSSVHRHFQHIKRLGLLTTSAYDDNNDSIQNTPIRRAIAKFKSRPGTYLLIPCIAALVGWFTNWLAVQMIFYPIRFRGIPLYVRSELPLGLIGWQGIVPCKTRPMTIAMVNMVTTHLLTVKEVFLRLDPGKVAEILAPQVPDLVQEIVNDILPMKWMKLLPSALYRGLDSTQQAVLQFFTKDFVKQLTIGMQQNIESVFNLENCVVNQMMKDRSMLGLLFQKCGQAELDFLTNSGLWFGFLLGIIQMVVALFYDNPWTLSVGGGIVGLATNWLALKWIFEPVDPTKIGPFIIQGQFLRRQNEVSVEFSKFFANKILTAEQLWTSVLTDPTTAPVFDALFESHFSKFLSKVTRGFRLGIEPETLRLATKKAVAKLPHYLPALFPYMDSTLRLEETLRERMMKMTSRQFERVLHPIFEEDELTLILAGAVLGFAAGLVQQGLETGAISVPDLWGSFRRGLEDFFQSPGKWTRKTLHQMYSCIKRPFTRRVGSKNSDDSDENP